MPDQSFSRFDSQHSNRSQANRFLQESRIKESSGESKHMTCINQRQVIIYLSARAAIFMSVSDGIFPIS